MEAVIQSFVAKGANFFHIFASHWNQTNRISTLLDGNRRLQSEEEITGHVVDFYTELFTKEDWDRPSLDNLDFISLEESDSDWLEKAFDEEEVKAAVFNKKGEKAPGPDGFPLAFFQRFWEDLKVDVMEFMTEFHGRGKLSKLVGASFIVIIAKKIGAESIKDFRPIRLIGSIYKVLAKVLASRMKKVLPKIISMVQGAFVYGRQILDGVLIANECIHSRKKEKRPGLICKLDLEKAYDRVDWDFLQYLMRRMGFGVKWRAWILECLSSATFSIIINGSPTGFFSASRGLRQGDPLSPFLFVIIGEALSRMLHAGVNANLFEGFRPANTILEISHLQFADDTLLFCNADEDQLRNVKAILFYFEAVSGLRVNFFKSELIGIKVNEDHLNRLANIFGCKAVTLPSTYLGLPLCGGTSTNSLWSPVLERMEKKLSLWKAKYLSLGGRVTLIKAALTNLPIYFMSLFKCPMEVMNRIEKMQRDFLCNVVSSV
eukprot:TRINITY_DN13144_c0_g1_i12.p1 TRINITY_DN13144_c0_g1~~TRINITY_DN13144_c0_g1_i12.p1  ORF type:complete len:489 (+),score=85.97 TRINITY_DN13144_c0_g1_i12:613-2079(+)